MLPSTNETNTRLNRHISPWADYSPKDRIVIELMELYDYIKNGNADGSVTRFSKERAMLRLKLVMGTELDEELAETCIDEFLMGTVKEFVTRKD